MYSYLGDDEQSDWVGNACGAGGITDDDTEPMKIDCQRLLSVSLQNNVLTEGRGPGRMPLWTRKVKFVAILVPKSS